MTKIETFPGEQGQTTTLIKGSFISKVCGHERVLATIRGNLLSDNRFDDLTEYMGSSPDGFSSYFTPDDPNDLDILNGEVPEILQDTWALAESEGITSDTLLTLNGFRSGGLKLPNRNNEFGATILPVDGIFRFEIFHKLAKARLVLHKGEVGHNESLTIAPGLRFRGTLLGSSALMFYSTSQPEKEMASGRRRKKLSTPGLSGNDGGISIAA